MFKTAVFVRFQPLRKINELDWLSIFPSEQYRLLIASHYATLRETVAFTMGVLKAHARISRPGCPQTTRSDRFNLHDSPKVRAKTHKFACHKSFGPVFACPFGTIG